jgi:ribose 5-phosphate isomerase RpiB
MRIAIVNETSAADKNADIVRALEGLGHEIVNCGMKKCGEPPELTYIHTGLIAALLLHLGRVDLVVGGCGTGQGFLNSVMRYPGVSCGLLRTPLDAWLFATINGGNCISLALNEGYGWAGDLNLRFLLEKFLVAKPGAGYPEHRRESQARSRQLLGAVSTASHRPFAEILARLPDDVVKPALSYPGIRELLLGSVENESFGDVNGNGNVNDMLVAELRRRS